MWLGHLNVKGHFVWLKRFLLQIDTLEKGAPPSGWWSLELRCSTCTQSPGRTSAFPYGAHGWVALCKVPLGVETSNRDTVARVTKPSLPPWLTLFRQRARITVQALIYHETREAEALAQLCRRRTRSASPVSVSTFWTWTCWPWERQNPLHWETRQNSSVAPSNLRPWNDLASLCFCREKLKAAQMIAICPATPDQRLSTSRF